MPLLAPSQPAENATETKASQEAPAKEGSAKEQNKEGSDAKEQHGNKAASHKTWSCKYPGKRKRNGT